MATLNYRDPVGQSHGPDIVLQSAFWADGEVHSNRTFGIQRSLDVRCTTEVTTETDDMMLQVSWRPVPSILYSLQFALCRSSALRMTKEVGLKPGERNIRKS